ncbi:MAG: HAD-IB family hydrolase, partial [Chlamydiia bacterium]|nr:HAD-IB family hydrolase [Chlamydiia bacterium]
ETDSKGVLTGKLLGANCRGPEKVRRILETFGPKESYLLYAYGDSAGDREMLALADHPFFRKI